MLILLVFDESTYEKVNITIITYFRMFPLIPKLYSMAVKQYNWSSNTHFNTPNFIETSTLKTMSEPRMNGVKCTSKTIS